MSYKELISDIYCDICRKKIIKWNPFNKPMRVVAAIRDNIWYEYYHKNCLIKVGALKKVPKANKGRWDDEPTSNLVH